MTHKQKRLALSVALARIADTLTAVGFGDVTMGKLARHLLKYKPSKNRETL